MPFTAAIGLARGARGWSNTAHVAPSKDHRVRVYVADDHPVYREGLARAIRERPELELVGEASDGRQALAEIKDKQPDVAVLDIKMPRLSGTEVLSALTRDAVRTRVVVLSAYLESALVYEAIAAGAAAYLSKDSARQEICEAIAGVARGETILAPQIHGGLAAEVRLRTSNDRPALTPREKEILVLTAEGCSAPEIGRRLHLSPTTVKTHLQHLYDKLGVSDRAAVVAAAMRHKLLE
jgi:two-component system nitrate/nitrite response regulator NarL